jgi:hypothetical protein
MSSSNIPACLNETDEIKSVYLGTNPNFKMLDSGSET